MAEAPVDIFTTIHRALWAVLNAYAPFTSLVLLNNRVDQTAEDFVDFKPNLPADATPEATIFQSAFTQDRFTVSDVAVNRSQTFNVVLTGGELSPVKINAVREAAMDGLLKSGTRLGITTSVNGNSIISWSCGGSEGLSADNPAGGNSEDRTGRLRFQSIVTVTVVFKKVISPRLA
jgi:hypothetical protein